MERFGLTRHDLMVMTWNELVMLFDSTYEEEGSSHASTEDVRLATEQDWKNWL